MSGTEQPDAASLPDPRDRLVALARLLRGAEHLTAESRAELADLLDELARHVGPGHPTEHLAESAAQAAHAVSERHPGLIESAREHLEAATARAEVAAPVATGVARRLVDLLAEIGI